ncbi:MAG: O-antigen ligase family protein [Phycisphaerae bacterium]
MTQATTLRSAGHLDNSPLVWVEKPEPAEVTWTLGSILREGGAAILVAFLLTAVLSGPADSTIKRLIVVSLGFGVLMGGFLLATKLSSRLILALACAVMYEWNYFHPKILAHIVMISPAVLMALLAWMVDRARTQRPDLIHHDAMGLKGVVVGGYIILLLCLLVAQAFSIAPLTVSLKWYFIRYIWAIPWVLAAARVVRNRETPNFADGYILIGLVVAASILIYNLTGKEVLIYQGMAKLLEIREEDRYGGLLVNPNSSTLIIGSALVLLMLRWRAARGAARWVSPIVLAVLALSMILAQSRGPILTVALLVMGLLLRRRWRKTALGITLLGVLGITFLSFAGFGETLAGGGTKLLERFQESGEGFAGRLVIMGHSLTLLTEYPAGLGESQEMFAWISAGGHVEHSEYVSFLVRGGWQSGMVAVVLMVTLIAGWAKATRQRFPNRPGSFVSALLAFFLIAFIYSHPMTLRVELNYIVHIVFTMAFVSLIYAQPQPSDVEVYGQS